MKTKIKVLLCMGILILQASGCADSSEHIAPSESAMENEKQSSEALSAEETAESAEGIAEASGVLSDEMPEDESATGPLFDMDETGAEIAAYEEFLTGKRTAKVAQSCYVSAPYIGSFLTDCMEDRSENRFSIDDLTAAITVKMRENRGGEECGIQGMEYALLDCGGKKLLALRVYGVDIYAQNDDSDLTMVLMEDNGVLLITYAVDSWARSMSVLFSNGYVFGGGSGGAECHYTWEGIIGADGVYRRTYDCHAELGQSLYGMTSHWEIWDENDRGSFPVEFAEYQVNEETIYCYAILDDLADEEIVSAQDREIIMDYLKDNEVRMGIQFLTTDEAWARVEQNRKALGVTDEMQDDEHIISWRTLWEDGLTP